MLEKTIKERVKKVLKHFGEELEYFMPVQTGYGKRDLDFICTYRGTPFRIETKAPGKKLRETQETRIEELLAAGVCVWVIDDGTNYATHVDLHRWLSDLEMMPPLHVGIVYDSSR